VAVGGNKAQSIVLVGDKKEMRLCTNVAEVPSNNTNVRISRRFHA